MLFAHDTEDALVTAAALINTAANGGEQLADDGELTRFLAEQQFSGSRTHDRAELEAVRQLRPRLRGIWTSDEATAAEELNALLREAGALPQLVKHDQWDWHIHAVAHEAPLQTRMGVEAAMALVDVVRGKEMERLRVCAAEDCDAVLIDLSKNRSKRYCDTGNCANRAHVAAYRARLAEKAGD